MKILHIISTNGLSGAEKHLKHLLPGMSSYGIQCELLIIHPVSAIKKLSAFKEEFSTSGIKVDEIITENPFSLKVLSKINAHLRINNISVVHTHLSKTDLLASIIKQFYFKQLFIISTRHGYREKTLVKYSPENYKITYDLFYYATKYTFGKINKNISISKGISQLFINFKLTKEFFPVIHHGVDVAPVSLIDENLFRKSSHQIVIVGRLEAYKGHQLVIEAMPLITKKFPDVALLIIGNGSHMQTLKNIAIENGVSNNVFFMGFQNDPYSFVANSDVVVVPSLFEPFGLVFIEAMGLKTPIVCFDVPAGNELIDNKNGCLVEKFNIIKLADKIIFLLQNPEECKLIAELAYQEYLRKYSTAVMVKNTANFYHSLNIIKTLAVEA